MDKLIATPVNAMQEAFNDLCLKGGGQKGGPARSSVQAIIRYYGQKLNESANDQMIEALDWVPDANPWAVAFAMGLCWGTIAKHEETFFRAAVGAIEYWNDEDRRTAVRFHLEKGTELLEKSLLGANLLLAETKLAGELPDSLEGLGKAQDRWLRALNKLQPAYIGPWNALALFMSALFAQPALAVSMREARPLLPPGGPITHGLHLLHRAHLIGEPPNTEHDDEKSAAISAAVIDNALMASLLQGLPDCSMVDVHTGIYLLGTRDRRSRNWLE